MIMIPLTERTFQSQMLTFLRKSSSVSSFLWPAIGLHGVQSFFYECPFVLKDSLICFADRRKGKLIGDFRLMNFTTFCLISICFLDNFFTHDIYPHPRPTTSTHYPRPTTFSYTLIYATMTFLWPFL